MTTDLAVRLGRHWESVPSGCWQWTGCLSRDGYPLVWAGRARRAHRVMYELFIGPIPQGLTIDHLCRNRACVNPTHLETVDHRTNVLRGEGPPAREARATSCQRGHPKVAANRKIDADGKARCRVCIRLSWHRRKGRMVTK